MSRSEKTEEEKEDETNWNSVKDLSDSTDIYFKVKENMIKKAGFELVEASKVSTTMSLQKIIISPLPVFSFFDLVHKLPEINQKNIDVKSRTAEIKAKNLPADAAQETWANLEKEDKAISKLFDSDTTARQANENIKKILHTTAK